MAANPAAAAAVQLTPLAAVLMLAAGSTPMRGASLYWSKFPVRTQHEARCMEFAYGAASQQVGDRYYENLTPAKVAEIIEKLRND